MFAVITAENRGLNREYERGIRLLCTSCMMFVIHNYTLQLAAVMVRLSDQHLSKVG